MVDKKIPLAQIISLALFLAVQTGGLVWWVSGQSAKIEDLQRRVTAQESVKASERLYALETLLPRVEGQLNRIEQKLDAMRRDR